MFLSTRPLRALVFAQAGTVGLILFYASSILITLHATWFVPIGVSVPPGRIYLSRTA